LGFQPHKKNKGNKYRFFYAGWIVKITEKKNPSEIGSKNSPL
jgi:hypothetical protein